MTEPLTPEDKARYNAQHGLPPNACDCHHGSARYCPVHSQKDYDDAARSTDEGLLAAALHNEVIGCRWSSEQEYNACEGPEYHANDAKLLLRCITNPDFLRTDRHRDG